ncbi:MAG: PaaI family thioesterase [Cellvibrionaceae bacterium]|nr:PaaI family thioesterase [Cellvibrionaceae bacterium]MCV6626389.1 PaaI family thioesterase [Cellvibrionaceae bacterium]
MAVEINLVKKLAKLMVTANKGDHFHQLGLAFTTMETGVCEMVLPYSDRLVGNPETGVVHGGAITALLDTCCGMAAGSVLEGLGLTPTMDLRIDYMGAAEPGVDIHARADIYRSSQSVIFARARAYHQGQEDRPIAHCVANFIRLDPEVIKNISDSFMPFLEGVEADL